jgi:GT2 family glycosyltransferase
VTLLEHARPLLSTPEGGAVAIDDDLLALWRAADGRTYGDLLAEVRCPGLTAIVSEALACMAEAGLLARTLETPRAPPQIDATGSASPVSAVVVVTVAGELQWLETCLRALLTQRHPLTDILVVDNGVDHNIVVWLAERGLDVRVHRLSERTNLATALNLGIDASRPSDFLFLLNPDAKAHPYAVQQMITVALATPKCAAVAPKLMLWRAPRFLNGIGNRVPGWGWGTDNGIGQIDLGQLDGWSEVPSACLSAMLVSRAAWKDVGPFDPGYPAYYEDADWSYRARLLGYCIRAAPQAEVLHAFGGCWEPATDGAMSPRKLRTAIIGRLRFSSMIPGPGRAVLLWHHFAKETFVHIRQPRMLRTFADAFRTVAWRLPRALCMRRRIQARRAVLDSELFAGDDLTPSMTWNGLPELTSPAIREYYAPLLRAGATRAVPEVPSTPSM